MTQGRCPYGDQVKVKVRNPTKCFGDLKVLDNISLDINKGDFCLALSARTGCGKTTFLNLLVADRADRGADPDRRRTGGPAEAQPLVRVSVNRPRSRG